MGWSIRHTAATAALLLSASMALADKTYIQEMAKLYEAGQAQKAYQLALQHVLEAEGNPEFDFYYGLAAIDSGHISQGVFALERLLFMQPKNHRVRLELARGYFFLEQYDRARKEFRTVLKSNPPPKVEANVMHFLDRIRLRESQYKTTAGLFVEFGTGYDTNVNSAPAGANFDTPTLGAGTLDDASLSLEDGYVDFRVGANVSHPIKPGVSLFGSTSISRRAHDEEADFDTASINLQGGVSVLQDQDQYRLSLQLQDYEVGHEDYRELISVTGDWLRPLSKQTQVSSFIQYAKMNYPENGQRDSKQAMGGLGLMHSYPIRWQPLIYSSLYLGEERASQDDGSARALVDRDIYGLSLGGQLTLNPKFSLGLAAQIQQSRYDEQDRFFLRHREDLYQRLSLKANWLLERQWSLRANLAYTDNRSNISINRYYRSEAGITLRYEY